MYLRIAFLIFAFWLSPQLSANYLEVVKNAYIYSEPNRFSQQLDYIRPHDEPQAVRLQLVSDTIENGYYRVALRDGKNQGWIYKSRVRQVEGSIPGDNTTANSSSVAANLTGDDVMRAHFINVGQGDATLLEFPCGIILIDAGGRTDEHTQILNNYVSNVLNGSSFSEISTIFVTHTHTDHNRSLQDVVESNKVNNYVHNGVYDGSGRFKARWMRDHRNEDGRNIVSREIKQSEIEALPARTGLTDPYIDPLSCADVSVLSGHYEENTAGWPDGEFENGNNKGIVIRVDYGEVSFLFTGDLEEDALETLVEYYEDTSLLDVDVYQVGHHGSDNGTNVEILAAMTPEVAVMSIGPYTIEESWTAWAYGHPRQSLVKMLEESIGRQRAQPKTVFVAPGTRSFFPITMHDAIYATGWDGNIVIEANPAGQIAVALER